MGNAGGAAASLTNHNGDNKTNQRSFANAPEPEGLLPRDTAEARLVLRGTPGQMVQLLDWTEFCCYLGEVRAARISHNATTQVCSL
jgi:hypothetical protein